jgi:hypothetical protein
MFPPPGGGVPPVDDPEGELEAHASSKAPMATAESPVAVARLISSRLVMEPASTASIHRA